MRWGIDQWGVPPSGSVVPGVYSDSVSYGPNAEDLSPDGTPAPDPSLRYIRGYLAALPFETMPDTQSLLSFVISVIERGHYEIGGPIQ